MPRRSLVAAIYRGVLHKLASGEWSSTGSVPSSGLLATEFACSQRVVQAAIRQAADAGLLCVRQRRPTVVLPQAEATARQLLDDLEPDGSAPLLAILVADQYFPLEGNVGYSNLANWTVLEARRKGIGTTIVPWPATHQLALVNHLMRRQVSAVLAVGFGPSRYATLHVLHERGVPVVTNHRRLPELDVPNVSYDEYQSGRRIVSHLAALGHRNMCLVTVDGGWYGRVGDVIRAWVDGLKELGLFDDCVVPCFITSPAPRMPTFSRIFYDMMRGPDRPTAFLLGHISTLRDFLCGPASELRIPEDISVVTFDTPYMVPPSHSHYDFSSVTVDVQRTAQCIVEAVERMLAGESCPPSIRVPMRLHLTDTVGPVITGGGETR